MYREIRQADLSEFHPTVWEKSPEVSKTEIYHAVWQLLLYFYIQFSSKILSVQNTADTNLKYFKSLIAIEILSQQLLSFIAK